MYLETGPQAVKTRKWISNEQLVEKVEHNKTTDSKKLH